MRPKSKSPGLFVTFEGTEGAGKSTLIRAIADQLSSLRIGPSSGLKSEKKLVLTREPGGSLVAERIREVILSQAMDPWCELFLYEAARAEHLASTVRPALARGEIVLCDRYSDSSLAYQAFARGLDWKQVDKLNEIATQKLAPHLTVFIDIDPAHGLARAKDPNRFENEGVAFQTRVRQGFLKAKRQAPRRWLTIKATELTRGARGGRVVKKDIPPAVLAEKVVREMRRRFPAHFTAHLKGLS